MDVIGELIADVDASGYKRARIAADAGMTTSKLSKILNRKQVPTVLEYYAIRKAIHREAALSREVVVDLERLRAALAESRQARDRSQHLTEILEDILRGLERSSVTPLPKRQQEHSSVPIPAAANPNAELLVELEATRKDIPRRAWNRGARMIARVTGDSMDGGADAIADGELAYLKPTRSPRTAQGKVTLVRRGDGMYLKLFESGHTIRLVSTNAEETVAIDARAESVQVYGIVVDHGRD